MQVAQRAGEAVRRRWPSTGTDRSGAPQPPCRTRVHCRQGIRRRRHGGAAMAGIRHRARQRDSPREPPPPPPLGAAPVAARPQRLRSRPFRIYAAAKRRWAFPGPRLIASRRDDQRTPRSAGDHLRGGAHALRGVPCRTPAQARSDARLSLNIYRRACRSRQSRRSHPRGTPRRWERAASPPVSVVTSRRAPTGSSDTNAAAASLAGRHRRFPRRSRFSAQPVRRLRAC